jgi:hypothetical protein
VTATGIAVQQPQVPWWHLRGHLRQVHDNLANPDEQAQTLLSGKRVHLRGPQSTGSGGVIGMTFACFVAGGYFGVLEQHWYIHIVIAHFLFIHHLDFNHGSGLKLWWDNLFSSKAWPDYRHALRNYGEPSLGVMGARTVLAKSKYWAIRISNAEVVARILAVLVLTFALALLGTYLLDFGLPGLWAHAAAASGHRGYTWDAAFAGIGTVSPGKLLVGFLIGLVLHKVWAPAGATIQGVVLDRAVDKAQTPTRRHPHGHVPLWEKLPLAPPVIRERFAMLWQQNEVVEEVRPHRRVISFIVAFFVLVALYGALAKFVIPHGIKIPYMNP